MLKEETIKSILSTNYQIQYGLKDELIMKLETLDPQGIAEDLLENDEIFANDSHVTYMELLKYFIDLCSYVEEETDASSIISDEDYDKLVAKYISLGGDQPIGASNSPDTDGLDKVPHKYPELRGSLTKLHFIYEKDIPKKDSRKSLEGYLNNVIRQLKDDGYDIDREIELNFELKYDGVSHILECSKEGIDDILTRGDVDNNLGKRLTDVFKKFFPNGDKIRVPKLISTTHMNNLPDNLFKSDNNFGIKVETYMRSYSYEMYEKEYVTDKKKCNRRSAVVSICNQSPDSIEPENELGKFLNMQPFQIASEKELELTDYDNEHWRYIGKINDRHQYLTTNIIADVNLTEIDSICKITEKMIDTIKELADVECIPIDGVVLSFLDKEIVDIIGRKNNKNMFQAAFKFPAGEMKTTIEKVEFQVGPIIGKITPLARLKPIKINGNTISNVTISNKDKMERLQIREGDEVLIKYDIVPKIFKDDTCKCSNNPLVEFPTTCPVCGGEVVDERCINDDCDAKIVGHIINFVNKNRIGGGIGYNTIVDFVNYGYLKSIGDLFRLYTHKEELYKIPGYGETSINSILSGINKSKKLYPHQILGSIGIPNLGLKRMELICRNVNVIGNLNNLEELFTPLMNIKGIGDKLAVSTLEYIEKKKSLIEDICMNVDLNSYEAVKEPSTYVYISGIRDPEFSSLLESKGISTENSFTKKVSILITNDGDIKPGTQKKIDTAKERGIEIITLSEAKERWK